MPLRQRIAIELGGLEPFDTDILALQDLIQESLTTGHANTELGSSTSCSGSKEVACYSTGCSCG